MVMSVLCLGNSILIEVSLEDSSEDTTEKWTNDVSSLVDELGFWCVRVDSCVHHFLENGLNDTDGWVEASSGNAAGSLNAGVQSNTDSEGIEWNILGSIMLDDLDNEGNEKESHHELNEHGLTHKLSTVVAAVGWAKLGEVVSSGSWEGVTLLGAQWESHQADGASKHSSEDLGYNNKDTVENAGTARLMSMLNHHGNGDCWVEVPTTYRTEHLGHDKNDEANTGWCA